MARGKIKNISLVQTADKEQSNDWEFPVRQIELANPLDASKRTGVFGVFRTDSNEYIGQYRGEKVLPYTEIVETFENSLNSNGLQFKRSFVVTGNGARFWGRYDIGNGVTVGNEGFNRVLRLQSSHDGSLTPGFSLEMERLLCLNGMIGLAAVFAMFRKHSTNLDLGFISGNVMNAIESGTNHAVETVERMSEVKLSDGQARNVLSNIVTMGAIRGVSPKTGLLIYNNWQNPTEDEKPLGNTLYRLYNGATRLTRDVERAGRFEMSRKANVFVTGAFDLAVRHKQNMQKLLAPTEKPLDFDGVTVSNN